jgi:adenylate cyclase
MFLNFVACVTGTCGILFFVMFHAVRGMDRAEAETERQYARSEALLTNILPASVATRLKGADAVIADRVADASILFADIAGFTARASNTNPEDLVRFLNVAFSAFDGLVERHGLEKIKTAGDAYIVVSGVPESRADHAQALAQFALDLRDLARGRVDMDGHAVPFRIGISSGPVVAGVVGTRRFFYDVWGDAVNVAARMESTGVESEIHVSDDFRKRLNEEFVLSDRGEVEVKGKGVMRTWLLLDHRGQRTTFTKAEERHVEQCLSDGDVGDADGIT